MSPEQLLERIDGLDKAEGCQDSFWLHWRGKVFSADEHFPRLDKIFLYMVWRESPDRPMTLRRIIGVKVMNRKAEPVVIFTTQNICRLTDEGVRGRIVRECDLNPGVQSAPAGLCKTLSVGCRPWEMNPNRSADRLLYDTLLPLVFDTPSYDPDPVPELFLTCGYKCTNLKLRNSPAFHSSIRAHVKYDSRRSMLENMVLHRADIGQDAGEGRLAYPFDSVFGQGIVAGALKPSLQSREVDASLYEELMAPGVDTLTDKRKNSHDGRGLTLWSKWVRCTRSDLETINTRHAGIQFEL